MKAQQSPQEQNTQVPVRKKSPLLAGICSIIPGMGQIYNGQFIKGIAVFTLFMVSIFLFFFNILRPEVIGGGFLHHNLLFSAHFSDERSIQVLITLFLWALVIWPLIFIYAIVDAISTAQRINRNVNVSHSQMVQGEISMTNQPSPVNHESTSTSHEQSAYSGNQNTAHQSRAEQNTDKQSPPQNPKRGHLFWAVIFLTIGFFGMLQYLDINLVIAWNRLWPLIPLALGLRLLHDYHRQHEAGQFLLGTFFTAVGTLFLLHNWGLDFPLAFIEDAWEACWWLINRFWWLALLWIGAMLLISYYHDKRKHQ